MSQQQLTLGSLDLISTEPPWALHGFDAVGDDGSWGSPQPIDVTLKSLLQDGSIVVTQGYDNREVSLRVQVTADDSDELASLEAALFAEIGKRNTLTWTPPDGWGQPTVFEVITSRMEHVFDDLAEALRTQRTYGVTFVCEPFARSANPFALTPASVTTYGTSRQKSGTVVVPGSAPMPGSLHISSPVYALADVLVYSWQTDGSQYAPPMRRYRVGGPTVTPDTVQAYSGATEYLESGTPSRYDIPVEDVPPGMYVLYARVKCVTVGTYLFTTTASTLNPGKTAPLVLPTPTTQATSVAGFYQIVPVGRVILPTVASNGTTVRIELSEPTGTVMMDELYLCNATIGRLTIVNGTFLGAAPFPGGAASNLWINSPTTDSPRPSIVGGTQVDQSDAFNFERFAMSQQPQRWEPGEMSVFTACAAPDAITALTGYARWHTHAGSNDGTA